MSANPKEQFKKTSRKSVQDGAMVNYVWLNDEPDAADDDKCSLPLGCLDRVYANAKLYPKAQFQIWIDPSHFNVNSRFFIDSHIHIFAPSNVVIRDIRDVAQYSTINHEFFGEKPSQDIWNRVDLARLIVLDHCLEHSDSPAIFYADFDIKNVRLNSPKMSKSMKQYGAIFAGTWDAPFENGFIGLERDAAEHLLPKMIDEGSRETLLGNCVYDVFCRVVANHANAHGADLQNREMTLRVAPGHMTKMKVNPLYREIGLN